MRRKTTVAIVSTVAGSTLLIGLKLAVPASAGETGWGTEEICASTSPSAGSSERPGDPSARPSGSWGGASARPTSSRLENRTTKRHHGWFDWRRKRPQCPSPTGTGDPTGTASPSQPGTPTQSPTASPTPTRSATPTPTASASCTTAVGAAANVASPGVGAVTVTIKVCNGVLSTSTGTISESNWSANTPALAALNTLAVQYYQTGMSKITYSGATLTANAYQTSLKSALSKAGI